MAIFHLHSQSIGRGQGRSAVAASAYRSATKLLEEFQDKATGATIEQIHDFRNKKGVVFSEIIAPDEAALWMKDREALWNLVQNRFDTRKDAVFAHEIDVALPVELTMEQNLELLREFIGEVFTKEGMIVDANIHYDNEKNPHAHLMLSTREIIFDDEKKEYTFGKKVRYWDRREFLMNIRRMWGYEINKHLKLHGFDIVVSHLSYKELGIDLLPGVKEGAGRNIEGSDRSNINANIAKANKDRISNNPELIIDILRKDRVVFTKDHIAKVLLDFMREDCEVSRDIKDETPESDIEMRGIGKYISALSKVMASDKLVCIGAKDLEGRILYTSKIRNDLERDLIAKMERVKYVDREVGWLEGVEDHSVEMLKNSDSIQVDRLIRHDHLLGVAKEDLNNKTPRDIILKALSLSQKMILSDQQKAIVIGVLNGPNVSVIEGLPGSGKTSVMKELAWRYKNAGYKVLGAAVSSSAAMELSSIAGISSLNITKFRYEMELLRGMISGFEDFKVSLSMDYYKEYWNNLSDESPSLLDDRSVLIVDEASMIDLTELHFIISEVCRSGAKLILLGDRGQIATVGIAGGLEKAADIFGILRLDEVRRQNDPDHREATKLLSEYKVSNAIKLYRDRGVFDIAPSIEEARARLVKDFVEEYISSISNNGLLSQKMIALAYTNEEVEKLNLAIRGRLKDSGIIYGAEFDFEKTNGERLGMATGDKVVFGQNSNFIGISNGDTGRVIGFRIKTDKRGARKVIRVRLDNEQKYLGINLPVEIEVDNRYYKSLSYGFAITISKSQGRTSNKTYGLITENIGFPAFNVMCTRHKEDLKLYASSKELVDVLYRRVDRDTEKAKREWNIYGEKEREEDIPYAGIAALAYKRDNRSLSEDYKAVAFDEPSRKVSEYIEVRNETLKLYKVIWSWLKSEKLKEKYGKSEIAKEKEAAFLKLQAKGEIKDDKKWDSLQIWHHPLYEELQCLISERGKLAYEIYNNYFHYSKILTQAGLNFVTIEKHAEMSQFIFKTKKNLPDNKIFGLKEDTIKLRGLLSNCNRLNKYEWGDLFDKNMLDDGALKLCQKISQDSHELLKSYEERRLDIEILQQDLQKLQLTQNKNKTNLIEAHAFLDNSIKLFLSKTYKDSPDFILGKWDECKNNIKHDTDKKDMSQSEVILSYALTEIRKNPQILGGLQGIGFGSILAFNPTRFRAMVNIYEVASLLERYEKYRSIIIDSPNEEANFNKKTMAIHAQIRNLEKGLVGSDLESFIQNMNEATSHKSLDTHTVRKAIAWSKEPLNRERISLFSEIIDTLESENHSKNSLNLQTRAKDISFEAVIANLGEREFERIFRQYSHIINPDGKLEKKGSRIICGSLTMDLTTGLWHRFSTGDGGNIFSWVREATGCSKYESLLKIASDIGMIVDSAIYIGKPFKAAKNTASLKLEPKNEWVPYKIIPLKAPKFNPDKHIKYKLDTNYLGNIYSYKNIDGELMGHTVRLVSKEDGSKEVFPVSYCNNATLKKNDWRLKGFLDKNGNRPIYGLDKFSGNEKPILIVEGEKTADKATELLPEYNVISWMGGAPGVSKVDWTILENKEVIIWPDNDRPGIIAARVIADRLNSSAKSIGKIAVIDPVSLNLPQKWDLADELPQNITLDHIRDIIKEAIIESKTFYAAQYAENNAIYEKEKYIIWQQKSYGFNISSHDAEFLAVAHQKLYTALSSAEVESYVRYGKAKGLYDSAHEFLSIKNPLYSDSLAHIELNFNEEMTGPNLLKSLESKYEDKISRFHDHIEIIQHYSNSLHPEKFELMKIFTRDVLFLHKMQLESTILADIHKEVAAKDIYDIIRDYPIHNNGKLSDANKCDIAGFVYDKLNSHEWWKDLSKMRLGIDRNIKLVDHLHEVQETKQELVIHAKNKNISMER